MRGIHSLSEGDDLRGWMVVYRMKDGEFLLLWPYPRWLNARDYPQFFFSLDIPWSLLQYILSLRQCQECVTLSRLYHHIHMLTLCCIKVTNPEQFSAVVGRLSLLRGLVIIKIWKRLVISDDLCMIIITIIIIYFGRIHAPWVSVPHAIVSKLVQNP